MTPTTVLAALRAAVTSILANVSDSNLTGSKSYLKTGNADDRIQIAKTFRKSFPLAFKTTIAFAFGKSNLRMHNSLSRINASIVKDISLSLISQRQIEELLKSLTIKMHNADDSTRSTSCRGNFHSCECK